MKELVGFFEKMDIYFGSKSFSERWSLILLPAILAAYLAWTIINPPAKDAHAKSVDRKKSVEKKIAEDKRYLNSITWNGDRDHRAKEYDKKIAISKKRVDSYKTKITLLDKNLYKLSDVLFNQKSWSLFLDSITTRAYENNLIIKTITNQYVDGNGSFGHVLEIGIRCQGSFYGIVKFMNDMEQSTLVTDIFKSNIYTETNSTLVNADINISVWGVNH